MLTTLFLASSLLFTGGMRTPGGGSGPISANPDMLTTPRVGLSTRADVIRLWGKPASEQVQKEHSVCTWPRGRSIYILTFNTRLDILVDQKIVKK